jgi:hypothetical protein
LWVAGEHAAVPGRTLRRKMLCRLHTPRPEALLRPA